MIKQLKNEKKKGPNKILIIMLIFLISFATSFGTNLISYKSHQESSVDNGLDTKEMAYTEFIKELESNNVEKATVSRSSSTFVFYLREDDTPYVSSNPGTEDFKEKLLLAGVSVYDTTYSASDKNKSSPYALLSTAISCLLTSGLFSIMSLFLFSMLKSFNIFESKSVEKAKKVSFNNIIGLNEIKNELLFMVSLMKNNPSNSNIRIPKGILLEGPPGNGKTMLAQALATEANVNFLAVNASDLTDKFIGETGKSVRKLFDKAKQNAPCILFVDEIDAIGSKRSSTPEGAIEKELNGVINTLLTKLDGISDCAGVTVIAATNMASSLDPALVRPGRFDKHFYIPNPDGNARKDLLAHYLDDGKKEKYNYETLVSKTKGCSCAEIENIVNESKLIALRENKSDLDESSVIQAIKQFHLKGISKDNISLSEKEKETISIHEAGHAIIGYYFANKKISEISICSMTSGVGGYTQTEPKANDNLVYSEEVFGDLVTLLGGKAAESVMFGGAEKVSLGSEEDINVATRLAMGYVKFQNGIDYSQFGESGTSELMKESKKVLDAAYEKAIETATIFKEKILLISCELIKNENLSGEQFGLLVEEKEEMKGMG